ncbi:MAG TPA: hypothetical protein VIT88_09360 [Pyrinomonadaceae bacterium]
MKSNSLNFFLNSRRQKSAVVVIVLIVWSVFVWRAATTFGPQSGHTDFNSDGAIPVLMANDIRPITVFDTYYYGADRWGGWPLIVARLVNHATGFRWSEVRLLTARTIWLFIGVLILALLNRRAALSVVLIGIVVLSLQYILRLRLYDLGQVYAWQITALLFGWFALRKWLERRCLSDVRITRLELVGYSVAVVVPSLLATLSSPLSGPLLCFIAGVETLRLYAQKRTTVPRCLRYGLQSLGLILFSMLAEFLIRINFHRHGLKHYQQNFKTEVNLDWNYLFINLKIHLQSLINFSWWPLLVLTLAFVVAGLAVVLSQRLRKKWKADLGDDTSFAIIGAFGIALINFLLVVAVDHVRLSLYDNRYLTPTFFFGSIGGLLVVWRVFDFAFRELNVADYAQPIFAAALLLLLTVAFPPYLDASLYKLRKETALTLAQKSPNAVLMGGYWETYVFAALQPTNMLTPLPLEGYQVRMPWTIKRLHEAEEVIVEYKRNNLGGRETPPPQITQYGDSLRLVDPRWYENSEYAFARYLKQPN